MLLELHNIQKRFGGAIALRDGNLIVEPGEVHLLLGENGAGKSTLMKIVAGMVERDAGRMLWRGQEVFPRKPADAAALGIAMVHQESLLAPHLTVAENIFLGREQRTCPGWLSRRSMNTEAARLIEQHGFPLQADWRISRLSPAARQLVEICRAVRNGSSLLIFDEPTSSLSAAESSEVFRIVGDLRRRGMGVIYITHRLEELRAVGDRVTVLRDGATIHQSALADVTTDQLISHMVGRAVSSLYSREPHMPGPALLEARGVTTRHVRDISFSVRAGEIVGLAGLIGAGRTEVCQALFGIDPVTSGAIRVSGKEVSIRSPRDAVAAGIALVTEDRQHTGLALRLPIAANVTMASADRISRFGLIRTGARQRFATDAIRQLRIKAHSPAQLAGQLSGGNQQKVVIAKWLLRQSRVFLFDEPTRGIDIGAKVEVFELMNELVKEGAAVLMVSSELQELLQVADRLIVMRGGRITGELPARATQEAVMRLAALEPCA